MTVRLIIITYLILINILGYIMMWTDKRRAVKHAYRIPEANLFVIALLGGSIGSIAGMYIFHHKTRHWYFVIGMPLILLIQIILILLLLFSPIEIVTL
ncbi:MAG: DUF1294 domain-containing protein [Lachnospiraceae bacterium]|nr:DUF1294 domain-containing protein [Lachnospiraceae bacterium]